MKVQLALIAKALTVLLCAVATSASGSIVNISQGLATGIVYGNNTSPQFYSSSFDAASFLGAADFDASYIINSAKLHFDWTDNNSDPFSTISNTGLVNTYGNYQYDYNSNYTSFYSRNVTGTSTIQNNSPSESASITVGTTVVNSPSTSLSSTSASSAVNSYRTSDGGSYGYWQSSGYSYVSSSLGCGFLWLSPCYSWRDTSHSVPGAIYSSNHQETTITYKNDYTGSFSLDIDLKNVGGNSFADLSNTGVLGFMMRMNGNAILNSATMTLDVTALVAQVPEPGMFEMLGIGLALITLVASRRQYKVRLAG